MFSKSYNTKVTERDKEPVAFVLMKAILNVKPLIYDEEYVNYLSSKSFDQMNMQLLVSEHAEKKYVKIVEKAMKKMLGCNVKF